MRINNRISGFTLVEVSIVLVILALLVGGILAGRDLIRAAEIKNILQSAEQYDSAIRIFKIRYNQLPGDMRNATNFWGAANNDPVLCKTTLGTGTQTCNGTGDGVIGKAAIAATFYERFRFWQHLSNAKLLEGSYTGIAGNTGTMPDEEPVIGTNVPESKIQGVSFSIYSLGDYPGDIMHYKSDYGNSMFIGSKLPNSTAGIDAFTPAEAYVIDAKMDDGKPGYGIMMTHPFTNPNLPNCTTAGSTQETAEYNTIYRDNACSLILKIGL